MSLRLIVGASFLVFGGVAMSCGGSDTGSGGSGGTGTGGSTPGTGGTTPGTGGSSLATGGGGAGTGGTPGTGGSASGGGGAGTGGTPGTGGSGGGGGAPPAMLIQDIQDGTVATGDTVTIAKVFVTSTNTSAASTTLSVQEPQGTTKAGVTYPVYAGILVNAKLSEVTTFNIGTIVVGDCVTVSAKVAEFHSNTELQTITAFAKASSCGTAPTPFDIDANATVHFGDIATDAGGMNAGGMAELYEDVLLRVHSVTSGATSSVGFIVTPTGSGTLTPNLLIDNYMTGPIATPAATYTTITGVLEQFDTYALYPRTTSDLVP